MKKLDFDSQNAHIVSFTPQKQCVNNEQKSGFDIMKLLQILQNLNLNTLFGGQNSIQNSNLNTSSASAPTQNSSYLTGNACGEACPNIYNSEYFNPNCSKETTNLNSFNGQFPNPSPIPENAYNLNNYSVCNSPKRNNLNTPNTVNANNSLYPPTQEIMAQHNLNLAKTSLKNHTDTVKKLTSN